MKTYFDVSISVIDDDDRDSLLKCQFDSFAEVLNYLDIINDYYTLKSLLVYRRPVEV